jgi:hypothetical protein
LCWVKKLGRRKVLHARQEGPSIAVVMIKGSAVISLGSCAASRRASCSAVIPDYQSGHTTSRQQHSHADLTFTSVCVDLSYKCNTLYTFPSSGEGSKRSYNMQQRLEDYLRRKGVMASLHGKSPKNMIKKISADGGNIFVQCYCSLSLWKVVRGSKLMHLELIHGLFIT